MKLSIDEKISVLTNRITDMLRDCDTVVAGSALTRILIVGCESSKEAFMKEISAAWDHYQAAKGEIEGEK